MSPNNNLYLSVNEKWLESSVIPDGFPTINSFLEIHLKTEKILMEDIENIIKKNINLDTKAMNEFIKLYKLSIDNEKKEKDGILSIKKYLDHINKIKTYEDFNKEFFHLALNSIKTPISFYISPDMKDTMKYSLYLDVPSTFLPNKSYYLDEKKYLENIEKFKEFTFDLLKEFLDEKEAKNHLEKSILFDKSFTLYIKDTTERSEYTKLYNERTLDEIYSYSKYINIKNAISQISSNKECKVVITEPIFFENLEKFINENTLDNIKSWMLVNFIISNSSLFTEKIRIKGLKFSNYLKGITEIMDFKKYYYQLSKTYFYQVVGIYYAKKYFGNKAKEDVEIMCKDIIEVYKNRLEKNSWLDFETKEKAIKKLNKIDLLIGFPETYDKKYDRYIIKENKSLFENTMNIKNISNLENFKKLHKEVDRKEWTMSADEVNAYYSPNKNLICFPAAILQAPFYYIKQSRSENYGAIGAVIAHEISHAFDSNGSKCDENGNIANWWKKEDFEKYEILVNKMIEQWEGLEISVGKVNGKLTVSENIADNGGLAASLEALKKYDDVNYKEFFTSWAKIWRMKAKDEYMKLLLEIDTHSPNILRANMQVKNFDEFYEAFDVKEDDEMYLAKDKRIVIW